MHKIGLLCENSWQKSVSLKSKVMGQKGKILLSFCAALVFACGLNGIASKWRQWIHSIQQLVVSHKILKHLPFCVQLVIEFQGFSIIFFSKYLGIGNKRTEIMISWPNLMHTTNLKYWCAWNCPNFMSIIHNPYHRCLTNVP